MSDDSTKSDRVVTLTCGCVVYVDTNRIDYSYKCARDRKIILKAKPSKHKEHSLRSQSLN